MFTLIKYYKVNKYKKKITNKKKIMKKEITSSLNKQIITDVIA